MEKGLHSPINSIIKPSKFLMGVQVATNFILSSSLPCVTVMLAMVWTKNKLNWDKFFLIVKDFGDFNKHEITPTIERYYTK